jgi:hypothetical protein
MPSVGPVFWPYEVETFCESAAQLLPLLGEYACAEQDKRTPEDDALVRQLRIAVSALAAADNVVRMTPMPMLMMPVPPNVGAPS